MKNELTELLELMVDIAMASEKPNNFEFENVCLLQQFTPDTQQMSSVPRASMTKSADAGKLLPKRA